MLPSHEISKSSLRFVSVFFKSNLITLIILKSLRITDCGAEMKSQSRTLRFWSASKRKWIVCKSEETLKVQKIRNLKIDIEKSKSFWSNPNSFKNWLFLIFKNYKRQGLFCIVTKPVIGCPDDVATLRKNTKINKHWMVLRAQPMKMFHNQGCPKHSKSRFRINID